MVSRISIGVFVLGWVVSASAFGGDLVLHPNGFGEHSYCSWKAQKGLPDSSGSKDQALYFQKKTATATFAAAVAVIEGIEGLPVSDLTGLGFYIATNDGSHCGAGAPRFNVRVDGVNHFIGCQEMIPGDTQTAPSGKIYQRRSIAAPALTLALGGAGTIGALEILFDEGDDVGTGFAFLDDVTVEIDGMPQVWTSATDNGNGTQ